MPHWLGWGEDGVFRRRAVRHWRRWIAQLLPNPGRERRGTRYRFPPEVIHQAIWLYLRFTLSFRDVEDLLAERGIAVSYETVRRWVNHFGPMFAAHLRKRRPKPHATWHLDEVYLRIDGRMVYLWRAVDAEGEVLDVLVQSKRDKHAALKLMRKLLKKYAFAPERLVTDDLRSYAPAARDLGIEHLRYSPLALFAWQRDDADG